MFPTLSQYNRVIQQQGSVAFRTLNNIFFIPARTSPIKIYNFGSGSFAVVFKALENNKEIAIRCFIGSDNDYVERYRKIDNYLRNIDESWKVNIQFLDNEINVDGKYYPVLKMDWVDGLLLNKYIDNNLNNNDILSKLQKQFVKISTNLEANKIAHGDIQCGNIIVKEINGKPKIKLIDYDGLYIPFFSEEKEKERGRSEFQHPNRSYFGFNEKIDRFSFWVILCALEALKYDKTLWQETMKGGFNTLDNMLFEGSDFSNPNHSKLFQRISNLNQPSLNFYVAKLKLSLNTSNIEKLSFFGQENSLDDNVADGSNNEHTTKSNLDSSIENNSNQYTRLKITSSPSGASIRNKDFEKIGITPLTVNKYSYINEEIKIIFGTKSKSIIVNELTNDINVSFDKIVLNKPKIDKEKPISPPIIEQKTVGESNPIIWIGLFIFLIIVIGVMISKKNENTYTNDYLEEATVDSVAVDSAAVFADTVAMAVDTIAFTPEEDFIDTNKSPTVIADEVVDAQPVATQSSDDIANNETYTIIEGKLRSEASPLGDIIKYIPSGKTVRVIGRRGEYFKVYYDGYTGYLNEMYLKKTYNMSLLSENNNKNSSQPISSANNSYDETYTIIEGKLRSEDNPLGDIIKYIPSGKTVRVIGRKGEYFKVYYDGYTGYLNEMYLKMTNSISSMKK
jgi:hypothetical protein